MQNDLCSSASSECGLVTLRQFAICRLGPFALLRFALALPPQRLPSAFGLGASNPSATSQRFSLSGAMQTSDFGRLDLPGATGRFEPGQSVTVLMKPALTSTL